MKMKAIVIEEPGGPEKLLYREVPTPVVKPGWSLVRVHGFGINHSEVFTRQGLSPSVRFPRILGIECVGEIADSTDTDRLPMGQKVVSIMGEMGRAFDGGYAEYCLLPNEQIYPVHTDMPWDVLAALPETYYTAYGSMKNLQLDKDCSVLVRGATSGVGVAFLRLVKARFPQMRIVGSTRSVAKGRMLVDTGFDAFVLDADGVLQTGEQFNRALELIGPATLKETCAHIREGGIVCSTGQLGGKWDMEGFDPIFDLPANGYLTSFYSNNVDGTRLDEMLAYVARYQVDAAPERVFTLEQVPDAHRYLADARSFGKVVVLTDFQ